MAERKLSTEVSPLNQLKKQLQKEVTCPVCLHEYYEPKFLQCHHIFCRNCILQSQHEDQVKCPVCRHVTPLSNGGVAGLCPAAIVERIMDYIYNGENSSKCISINIDTPTVSIENVEQPWGVATTTIDWREDITEREERMEVVMVTENTGACISIYNLKGKKLKSFGTFGSCEGQFDSPRDIAIDSTGCVLVADENNHRIQKFSAQGNFIEAVGKRGSGPLEFQYPHGITVHPKTGYLYVTEIDNHRVHILNPDLTFVSFFGGKGTGKGLFEFPYEVACSNNSGRVYVVDSNSIQVFREDGTYISRFAEKSMSDTMKFAYSKSMCISHDNNILFVTDWENHRIMAFTFNGKLIQSVGGRERLLNPRGLAVGRGGTLWVSDENKLQCFSITQ